MPFVDGSLDGSLGASLDASSEATFFKKDSRDSLLNILLIANSPPIKYCLSFAKFIVKK